jgi:alkylation response protein AidB-like acyl-CoA dehydrogenase
MNFDFSPEQQELRDTIARALADGADWQTLADLGLFALLVPEAKGGMGMSLVDVALIIQELGGALAPLAITDTLIATDLIARHKKGGGGQDLLSRIAAGKIRIALAWQEPNNGYWSDDIASSASWGSKILVADADAADMFLVSTDKGLVLVDKSAVTLTPHDGFDPSCAHHQLEYSTDSAIPLGFWIPRARLFDVASTVNAGLLLGISEKLLARSADYARERIQFDKPIGSFQGIKHKCADMAVQVEAAKSVAYYAFWAVAEDAPDRARASSMAKAWCGDVASKIGAEAIQIHGGMGFTWELGLHHYLRRAKVLASLYGDANWHRERVLAITLDEMETA